MYWKMSANLISLVWLMGAVAGSPSFYEILLTQKGFTQFIEYDVAVPPMSEFTFCVWIRASDLAQSQPIFTYIANSNRQLISIWLEAGGGSLHIRFGREPESVIPVDWTVGVWRHLCLSWQADSGAWATYQDGHLLSCLASDNMVGFVFPGGGRILLGYGAVGSEGTNNGWEGDIYGFNMILYSTIERNFSLHNPLKSPKLRKNPLRKNKMVNNVFNYIKIGDLDVETTKEDTNEANLMVRNTQDKRSHIQFNTIYSHVEHDVGLDLEPPFSRNTKHQMNKHIPKISMSGQLKEEDSLGIKLFNSEHKYPEKGISTLWSLINKAGKEGQFKKSHMLIHEQTKLATENLPVLSEFETPPPPNEPFHFKLPINEPTRINEPIKQPPHIFKFSMEEIMNTHDIVDEIPLKIGLMRDSIPTTSDPLPTISLMETPPKISNDDKVYGHWSGHTFAGSVLGFLKYKNIHSKPTPKTIPLKKIMDSFPYASEQKPFMTFPTRSTFHYTHLLPKPIDKLIRRARSPKKNLEVIIDDNLRHYISQRHANEKARHVQVSPRGETSNSVEHRMDADQTHVRKNEAQPQPFRLKNHKIENTNIHSYEHNPKSTKLPFITIRNQQDLAEHFETARGNKWRNIQTFNNEFSPRYHSSSNLRYQQKVEDTPSSDNLYANIFPKSDMQINSGESKTRQLDKDRAIAFTVSKMSDLVNGFVTPLPIQNGEMYAKHRNTSLLHYTSTPNNSQTFHVGPKMSKLGIADRDNTFYKPVKLGNALNEYHIIGKNDEEKRKSFIEGDDKIPDIHRHRSDIDENGKQGQNKTPPSLGPRVCEQTMFSENKLFVQPDGSIDLSGVYSSMKKKNPTIFLLEESLDKCAERDFQYMQSNFFMLIRWKETPVRLFGGAKLKKNSDLCKII